MSAAVLHNDSSGDATFDFVFTDVDLIAAADTGHEKLVSTILDNFDKYHIKVDCHFPFKTKLAFNPGGTALLYASRSGHESMVKLLISKYKSDIKVTDYENWNSLHYSCYSGHVGISDYLYNQCGVDNTLISTVEKSTPIQFAQYRKYYDLVDIVFKNTKNQTNSNSIENNKNGDEKKDSDHDHDESKRNKQNNINFTKDEIKGKLQRCVSKTMKMLPSKYRKYTLTVENFDTNKNFNSIHSSQIGNYLNRYQLISKSKGNKNTGKDQLHTMAYILDSIRHGGNNNNTNDDDDSKYDIVFEAIDTAITNIQKFYINNTDRVWIRLCHNRIMAQKLCKILTDKYNVSILRSSAISAFHYLIVILQGDEKWLQLLQNGKIENQKKKEKSDKNDTNDDDKVGEIVHAKFVP